MARTKIHGGEDGEVAEEFFYIDEDGMMRDADLHDPILRRDRIDESIMGPIRKKYQSKYGRR